MSNHAVVAFLRWRFGLDDTAAALDEAVLTSIAPLTIEVEISDES